MLQFDSGIHVYMELFIYTEYYGLFGPLSTSTPDLFLLGCLHPDKSPLLEADGVAGSFDTS